jgi:transglutaminase-like putative cysteine protease
MSTEPNPLSMPEDSCEIRIACLAMSVLSVLLAYRYINEPANIVAICLSTIFAGSYLSYYYRASKNPWLVSVAILGTVIIMGNFVREILFQHQIGRLNPLIPFIAALAQLQSLHSLDLRTKADTNTSVLIGVALLGSAAFLGQDILFAITLLLYLVFAAFFLYRQSVAFTFASTINNKPGNNSAAQASTRTSLPSPYQPSRTLGSTVLTVTLLPACTVLFSLTIPHIESAIDQFTTTLLSSLMPRSLQIGSPAITLNLGKHNMPPANQPSGMAGTKGSPVKTRGSAGKENSASMSKPASEARQINSLFKSTTSFRGTTSSTTPSDGELENSTKDKIERTAQRKLGDGSYKEEQLSLLSAGKKQFNEENQLLLTIKSSRSVFLKRLTFDYFDGINWYLEDRPKIKAFESNPEYFTSLVSPPDNQSADGSVAVNEEITAKSGIGHYIPAAWRPVQIAFPADRIFVDQAGNLKTKALLTAGLSYRLLSNVPVYNLSDLPSQTNDFGAMLAARQRYQNDLQLPATLAAKAAPLAQSIVGKQTNWFSQAELICKYLRANCKYSLICQDKAGASPINDFLFISKTGDCTRFASAFAVLCRSLRIPTRCVGGFAPGTPNLASGLIEIRAAQSHAWAEVFLPNYGWVPFDPVPGGYLPDSKPSDSLISQMAKSEFASNLKTQSEHLSNKLSFDSFFHQCDVKLNWLDSGKAWLKTGGNLPIMLAFAALGVLLLYFLGRTYLVGHEGAKPRPATVIFLEVMHNLRKIQVIRLAGDTPEEVMSKVLSRLEELGKPKWQHDLLDLLGSFLDSYCLNRFTENESPNAVTELKEKSRQIEKLLASAR